MVIDGKRIQQRIFTRLSSFPKPKGELVAVLVGNDPASVHFLNQKEKAARSLGIAFRRLAYPAVIGEAKLVKEIKTILRNPAVGGVIVQLPLPRRMSRAKVLAAIDPAKDPDCLTSLRLGEFYGGDSSFSPPAAGAVDEILKGTAFRAKPFRAAVIGAGFLVGRPVASLLLRRASEVAVFRSATTQLRKRLAGYDIVVSGAGRAGLFRAGDLTPGALVIDFGYAAVRGVAKGDFVRPTPREERRVYYTPVPGGTGPVVVAKLMENFYRLCDPRGVRGR